MSMKFEKPKEETKEDENKEDNWMDRLMKADGKIPIDKLFNNREAEMLTH